MRRSLIHGTLVIALLAMATAERVHASIGAKWTDSELSTLSEAVVTGRVVEIRSGWDPAVDTIYTYVTLDVDHVLKGALAPGRVTIKQLGGIAGEIGLAIADQPNFSVGEEVLLFLEVRPRDRTLYTASLWQGKWSLELLPDGEYAAVRRGPGPAANAVTDRRSMSDVRAAVEASARGSAAHVAIETSPADHAYSLPFVLMSTPYRYGFAPAVDLQSGGQPGLPGGGGPELAASINRWNNVASNFSFQTGSGSGPARCSSQFLNNSRVTIAHMDPCGEISNAGGTLAIGGSYFSTGGGTTFNGVLFRTALEGFVIMNDSTTALQFLRTNGCYADIVLHELGHVAGLGHSADANAIMFPSISNSCTGGAHALGQDDHNGLIFIYGGNSAPGPVGTPTGVSATVVGSVLNVAWSYPAASPTTSTFDLNFFSSSGPLVATAQVGNVRSVGVGIPPGTVGTFTVRVTARVGSTPGNPSAPATFTVGGGPGPGPGPGPCTSPPQTPTGLTGSITGGIASIRFNPSPGATSYIVRAGTSQGASNLFNEDIGNNTAASSPVPAGFRAYVRVIALNACGASAPTADFIIGLTLGEGDLQVTLSWNTATDMDLHIIEPDGTHVYYANRNGRTARLDFDNTSGFGPENIFVSRGNAASGTYQVFIVHYSGNVPTTSTIQVRVNPGASNERFAVFTRSSSSGNPGLGFNVADVNILANTITERGGTRAADERSEMAVPKKGSY